MPPLSGSRAEFDPEPANEISDSLADGAFLGASNVLAEKPTHLTIQNGGLYVSAGTILYWGRLPTTVSGALSSPMLSLAPVTCRPRPRPPATRSAASRSQTTSPP